MNDLVYFGYEYDEGSRENEIEFKKEIKERFPDVILNDAYDQIKGYRQEVSLDDNQKEDYHVWLIGKQWYNCSLGFRLESRDVGCLIEKAQLEYPESFKKKAEK